MTITQSIAQQHLDAIRTGNWRATHAVLKGLVDGDFSVSLDGNGDYTWPSGGVLSLGGAEATNALVAGAGASGAELELGTTAGSALDFRFRGSHTSGDMRGMYLRLDFDGAGGSGEALRSFVEIENVAVATGGTVNSYHATLEIDGDSGQVSGAGNVIRATLGGSGTKTLGGTLSGINIHLDLPSDVTLPALLPAIRLTKTQDHEWTHFASFTGIVGAGNAVIASAKTPTGAATHAVRMDVDGTDIFIPGYDDVAFNADD